VESLDVLAAEMPKRRASFRSQLSRSSRVSDGSDRDQLLADTSQEIDEGKTLNGRHQVMTDHIGQSANANNAVTDQNCK